MALSSASESSSAKKEETWWGSWLEAAKEKSAVALQQVSHDLQEFTSVIQRDTSQAVASSASVLGNTLKKNEDEEDQNTEPSTSETLREGFYNILSNISHSLKPSESDGSMDDDYHPVHDKDSAMFDKSQARLHDIQIDPATYCNEPDGHPEFYQIWQDTFKVDENKGEISELLVAKTEVRSLYTKLVPTAVSHAEFWGRYFYKIHQLNKDEARRIALKERAEMSSSQNLEEELGWGDEDDSWDTMPDLKSDKLPTEKSTETPPVKEQSIEEENLEFHTKQVSVSDTQPVPDSFNTEKEYDLKPDLKNTESELKTLTDENVPNQTKECKEPPTELKINQSEERKASVDADKDVLSSDEKAAVESEGKSQRSPTQSSDGSSGNKESSSLGDEWEKDFDDIEITEEDIKNAALAKGMLDGDEDLEEWENWE